MPSITKHDGAFVGSMVTGPSHNTLHLRFTKDESVELVTTKLPAVGSCDHGPIDEKALADAVMKGLAAAHRDSAQTLHVSEIIYIADDSPRYGAYAYLAMLLAEAAMEDAEV